MPAPQASYVSRSGGYDPATLSVDEDGASDASRSTWASSSDATILGLVDGLIAEEGGEREDWRVSRVGGVPSFPLSNSPPQDSRLCLSCRTPMPLLTQLYVPLPSSSLERVAYLFACPSPSCRKAPGTVRAFRANAVWVEGVEQERKEKEERERREREKREREDRAKTIDLGGMIFGGAPAPPSVGLNPFAAASNPFALSPPPPAAAGAAAFNPFAAPTPAPAAPSNPFASSPSPAAAAAPPPSSSSSPSAAAAAAVEPRPLPSASTSSWPSTPSTPSYPPMYINTMYEPASASSSSSSSYAGGTLAKHLASVALSDSTSTSGSVAAAGRFEEGDEEDDYLREGGGHREGKGAGGRTKKGAVKGGEGRKDGSGGVRTKNKVGASGGGGGDGWGQEGYEVQKVKGVDEVFLRFQEVVAREGRQVVRYDFSTQPLPFSASSAAYRSLFPPSSSSSSSHPMSTPAGAPSPDSSVGTYTPSLLPRCKSCGAKTTFEYQLMPHLVGVLSPYNATLGKAAAEGEEGKKDEWGVEFASVWVFSCEAECVEEGEGKEGWREEVVRVEWEEE
ncbi:hypothetical protein JCM11251_006770 [Rhodosporidiobolus azoricus]